MIARTLTKIALLGALGAISTAACSSSPTAGASGDEESAANDMDASVPLLSALSLGTTPAPASACSVSSTGNLRSISFSSSLDCSGQAGAPGACTTADHLALRVTSQLDAMSDGSSTTWTITRGANVVLSTASVWGNGFITTDVTYGPEFVGVQKATFREDGKTLAGSVNGRAIAPVALDKLNPRQAFLFADHTVIPQATTSNPDTFAEVARLLKKASAEASSSCVVTGGIRAPDAAAKRAASRLSTVLWRSGAVTPPTGGGDDSMARKGADQGAGASARAEGASAKEVVANDAPPAVPGTIANSPAVNDRTRQNDLLDWTTPACTHCETEVAKTFYCWGPWLPVCELDCFIPGNGCAENICPISSGIGSCDTGHECCGSRCCGGAEVCGSATSGSNVSYSQGYCCPKEFPVACGDMTAASCFPAGTKCCGNLRKGCTADTVCTHVTALSATCCAPSHVAKDGSCCDVPTVDGVCCPAGQNVCNGACCLGACVNNQCCDGFNQQVCNGACCDGTCCGNSCCPSGRTCTAQGTCCGNGQDACGSVCCAAGTACADPSTSRCTAAPLLEFWNVFSSTGSAGNITCGTKPCQHIYWGSSVPLRGTGFAPGGTVTLTLALPAPSPVQTFTATVDASGAFLTTISVSGGIGIVLPITATETKNGRTYTASALGSFEQLH